MQIDITPLLSAPAFTPFDLSNSAAVLGQDAGRLTWQASQECATDGETPALLDTEEKREAFRGFVKSSGGWSKEEIAAWSDSELYALFVQWVAGDIREAFGDSEPEEWDWADYEERSQAGQVSASFWKDDAGRVFFSISA